MNKKFVYEISISSWKVLIWNNENIAHDVSLSPVADNSDHQIVAVFFSMSSLSFAQLQCNGWKVSTASHVKGRNSLLEVLPSGTTDKWISCSFDMCYHYICLLVNQNATVSATPKRWSFKKRVWALHHPHSPVVLHWTKLCSSIIIGICSRWHLGIVPVHGVYCLSRESFAIRKQTLSYDLFKVLTVWIFFPKCLRVCTGRSANMGCGTL